MKVIYQYIENRTYDCAVKNILDRALVEGHVSDERQYQECLTILQISRNTLNHEGQALRYELWKLRF